MALLRYLKTRYKVYLKNEDFIVSFLTALALLAGSIIINFFAGIYATERASNAVTDIVLSNIRVFDVDAIFIYGTIFFWTFVGILCLFELKWLPFTFKSIALFVLIRSVFISLTHIGPFHDQVIINPASIVSKFTFGGDLFFSAHTGLPFLLALIFWDKLYLRLFFILTSIVFGTVVLLGHLHYSIDVLSAFFITFTIYHIAEKFFKKDHKLFITGIDT